jgi:leader peptidase (prepilin peptidase)/N-methyltransferase
VAIASVFILGSILGSFLNVCIYRLPRGESIFLPPSCCPQCGQRIKLWDNIPILSYLLLRGKCRACKGRISFRYPLVEFLTGSLLALIYFTYGPNLPFIRYSVLCLILITVSFIDLDHRLVLNIITIPGIILGLLITALIKPAALWNAVLGLLAGGGFLYLTALLGKLLFRKESMGGGDIKLAALIGIFVGPKEVFMALLLAFFVAALVGLVSMGLGKARATSQIPFAPFISLGTLLYLCFGGQLVKTYLRLIS